MGVLGLERTGRRCHPEGRYRPLTAYLRAPSRSSIVCKTATFPDRKRLFVETCAMQRTWLFDFARASTELDLALSGVGNGRLCCFREGQREPSQARLKGTLPEGYAALV